MNKHSYFLHDHVLFAECLTVLLMTTTVLISSQGVLRIRMPFLNGPFLGFINF